MAKPRVFVSSTYYDLKHIRDRLEEFLDLLGYEPVLFESGDVPFDPERPLDVSCYEEVQSCQIMVLIIGGRYGSPATGETPPQGDELEKMYAQYNSITKKEYEQACERDIPIYILVDAGVLAEYETYKHNRDSTDVKYPHVDSINVFRLLDEIFSRPRNNPVRGFERFDDIASWLKAQWAGLFAGYLSQRGDERTLKDLATQLSDLRQVTGTLREYSEAMLRTVKPDEAERLIDEQQKKFEEARLKEFEECIGVRDIVQATGRSPKELLTALQASETVEQFLPRVGGRQSGPGTECEFGDPPRLTWAGFDSWYADVSKRYATRSGST